MIGLINYSKHCHFNNLIFAFVWVIKKLFRFNHHFKLILFLFYQIYTEKDQIELILRMHLKKLKLLEVRQFGTLPGELLAIKLLLVD